MQWKGEEHEYQEMGRARRRRRVGRVARAVRLLVRRSGNHYQQQVDFTDPYCNVNQSITVRSDSGITDVAQLEGKKIGAQSGTTGYEWAAENIKDAEVTGYDEMTAVFAALDSGQIDAVSVDLPVANYYVRSYSDCQVIKEIPTGEQYAVAVSKENPELTKALNKALQAVHDNGKYDELAAKWRQ